MLTVFFDTSILFSVSLDKPPAQYRLLRRLCRQKKLRLHVPEIAYREFVEQRYDIETKRVRALEKAIKDVEAQPWVQVLLYASKSPDILAAEFRTRFANWETQWRLHVRAQLGALGFEVIGLRPEDLKNMLDDYFTGAGAFAAKRSRADIPDGLVLQALRTLPREDVVFLCEDERLSAAAVTEGFAIARSIDELFGLGKFRELHADVRFALWWEENHQSVAARIQAESLPALRLLVDEALPSALEGLCLVSHEIPDDNHEARISGVYGSTMLELDWRNAESLGEGILAVPIRIDAEVSLSFSIYRGDAFELPNWVNASPGQFEHGHYLDAEGTRVARFVARIVISFEPDGAFEGSNTEDVLIDDLGEVEIQDVEFEELIPTRLA